MSVFHPCFICGYSFRSTTAWLIICVLFGSIPVRGESLSEFDLRRIEVAGLRILKSRHLQLVTDLPSSPAVDELPVVFDAAVPGWADYFNISSERTAPWKMRAFLIQDRAKFAALGLLPQERPDFINGFASAQQLWLVEQPSDYYRRHLLLHEGTHGFMQAMLGGTGPGWYMEGMAELFGTHLWQDNQLLLRRMPPDRLEVPMWGRIKLVREAALAGKSLDVPAILSLNERRAFSTNEYAWCWAFCKFLDAHPRRQKKFRQLSAHASERRFNEKFCAQYIEEWPELLADWQRFVAELDYGYDTQRMAIEHRPTAPLKSAATVTIAADRGWQSTGWLLRAGREYQLTASGRFTIAHDEVPWPCEAGGVTLRYHTGQPLGMLMGIWREEGGRFLQPEPLGLHAVLRPERDAVLYLRVNDSPAGLSDNRGELTVSISRGKASAD